MSVKSRAIRRNVFEHLSIRFHEYLPLTLLLVGGLAFGAPAFASMVSILDIPLPLPILFGVGIVGVVYGLSIFLSDHITLGLFIAVIVTSTFNANIPLLSGRGYIGSLGPQIWLMELPLIAFIGILAIRGAYTRKSLSKVELFFGAYIVWSVLSALFGVVRQQDTALFYSLYLLNPLLAFGVSYRAIKEGVLTYRRALAVFVITIGGHAAFGALQFINQAPFGFSFLGETGRSWTPTTIDLAFFGQFSVGNIISGLAGGSGPLSVLLVITIPLVLAFAVRFHGARRIATLLAAVFLTAVLRTTEKDAARGALFLAVVVFVGLGIWSRRNTVRTSVERLRQEVLQYGFSLLILFATVFYPSSAGGTASQKPAQRKSTNATSGGTTTGSETGAGGQTTSTASSTSTQPPTTSGEHPVSFNVTDLSIPLFSLSSLGIRIQQIFAGIAMGFNYPVFGVGGANYPYFASAYGLPKTLGGHLFPLHNIYAGVLAETGVPGLLFYLLSLTAILWGGWRLYKQSANGVFVAGILASVVGYLAISFWIPNTRFTMYVPFWIVAGVLIGRYHQLDAVAG